MIPTSSGCPVVERRETRESLLSTALVVCSDLSLSATLAAVATEARVLVGAHRAVVSCLDDGSPGHRASAESLGEVPGRFGGSIVAPVRSPSGGLLGVLEVHDGVDGELDGDADAVVRQLAALAAVAITNATRFERESRGAEILQRAMLADPPRSDQLEVAVRYLPAAQHDRVGGDWYDAFLQPDGATVLSIGDVAGHDLHAAAAMGQLRAMLRASVYDVDGPASDVLRRVDRAVVGLDVGVLATTVLARVEQTQRDRRRGVRRVSWSNAGHLPPVLLHPDGWVEVLNTEPDLLIGLRPAAARRDHEVELPPGATLLLYTDGLVERRDRSLEAGIAALADALAGQQEQPIETLCDRLISHLLPVPQHEDDVAVLAVRVHPLSHGDDMGHGDASAAQ